MTNEITLKTEHLKDAVSKAVKGSGRIAILPITEVIGIEVKNKDVILTTTDNTTNLIVRIKDAVVDPSVEFYACTDSDLFGKLVAKTSSDTVTLKLSDNSLLFAGNGVHNLPLILEVEGGLTKIKPIKVNEETAKTVELSKNDLDRILQYNKNTVMKTLDTPILTGYCFDKSKVVTFNQNNACITDIAVDMPRLLVSSAVVNLFSTITDEKATVRFDDRRIVVTTSNVDIEGTLLENADAYPVEELKATIGEEAFGDSFVKVSKQELNDVLDRIALFVSNNEEGIIELTVGDDGLYIKNRKESSVEKVSYIEHSLKNTFTKYIDIRDFKSTISSLSLDYVILKFSEAVGLMIEENGSKQIIPQINVEEDSGEVEETEEEEVDETEEELEDEAEEE